MVTPVALVAATVRVEEAPSVILAGAAVMVTVGAVGAAFTVTTALAVALPPLPVAVAVYVVVAAGETDCVPPVPDSV
jgi:transketolase N-terminal domain/subunit